MPTVKYVHFPFFFFFKYVHFLNTFFLDSEKVSLDPGK